jgi:lactate dehydrogenase-like 2-hydroxyacid dehydrogenase
MSNHIVTVTRRLPVAVEARLAKLFGARLNATDTPFTEEQLSRALAESDAIVSTLGDPLNASAFNRCTVHAPQVRTRIIAHFGVGFDNVDVAAAASRGVVVTNTPGVLTDDTADLAMLLMLAVARRTGEGERELRAGQWTGWRPTHLLGTRVSGKTLGVIGFGRIGQAVAQRARDGFGMRVSAWSRSLTDQAAAAAGVTRYSTIESLLASSDFVSVHVPSNDGTRHLMNAGRLAAMRRGAFLINTARGDVVDEIALISALNSGTIAGAGLDVFEGEPNVRPELTQAKNIVLLPHIGSATEETRTAMGMLAIDNLEAFLGGREPPNRVA